MIRRHRNSIAFFLCFQAMAVAIICLGSLINFHQYKIWGKPLIPNFVGYKRDIEKYSKTLSFYKVSRDNQHIQGGLHGCDLDLPNDIPDGQCKTGTLRIRSLSQKALYSNLASGGFLRGPPSA